VADARELRIEAVLEAAMVERHEDVLTF
jgi:hypothetical protein